MASLRVELAAFRRTAAGVVKDPAVAAALAAQVALETPIAMAAFTARPVFGDARSRLADAEADFTAAAELMAKLVVFHGLQWQGLAAELLEIAKG